MKEEIKKISVKWGESGLLNNLEYLAKTNIALLLESEATQLLRDEGKLPNPWSVYMVECSDGTIYTGISNNVFKRVLRHNEGKGAKYTKTRLPVSLKWQQPCENRSEASKLEYKIKKLSKQEKLKIIESYGK